jgi:hypothetical protein
MMQNSYYMYVQTDKKLTTTEKIEACIDEYMRLHGATPKIILVNPTQVVEIAGYDIRAREATPVNNFWMN